MSYAITIENKQGDQLQLTQNPNYIVKATGLNPVVSDIITSTVANYSGERFVTSRQQKRNLVLTIYVREPVETNRINLYKYIKSHDFIRVYYKNNTRNVYIDGYVESFNLDHFNKTQTAQVSIICPQPNFIDVHSLESTNSEVTKGFYFKFNTEIKESSGVDQMDFTGINGVIKFSDFLAGVDTTQDGTPTPTAPVDITGLGELLNGAYYTRLGFNTSGRVREVTIPLGEQIDGINLIRGGASLISDNNYLISNIFIDNEGSVYTDENNNILYE